MGAFRVPKAFDAKFGKKLPYRLMFKCKNFIWKGKYDAYATKIYGLQSFVMYYGIRIFNIVQFDYHGDGKFTVKIFKESAIECNYPSNDPNEFQKSENASNWREDEYLIDRQSLEYQKSLALLCFNGFQDEYEYGEIKISSFDIDPRLINLRLKPSLENFYKNWEQGTKVHLRFIKRTWQVEVEWMAGRCMFGKDWYDFAHETELDVGDTLVLYKNSADEYIVNVCIYKGRDYVNDVGEGSTNVHRSFYKMVSRRFIKRGLFIVPKLVKDKYNQKLVQNNKIEVVGAQWFTFYNEGAECVDNLDNMIKTFSLREKETIICTMDDINIMYVRIYQEDGMELDYIQRMLLDNSNSVETTWYWHVDYPSDSDYVEAEIAEGLDEGEEDMLENDAEDIGNDRVLEFSTILTKCHVNNKTQGVFIPSFISPQDRDWKAGERISLITDLGTWSIGLAVSNGRAKCSAGWNKFAAENKLEKGSTLVFTMAEEAGGVVFQVQKVRRR